MLLLAFLSLIFSRSWHDRAILLSSRFVFSDNKSVRILFGSWFKICQTVFSIDIWMSEFLFLKPELCIFIVAQSRCASVPFVSLAKSKSVSSSIFNVRARHMERLIRYLSVHFVDSVEIPSALRYASYFVACWYLHASMRTRARAHTRTHTHSLCLFSSSYFSIYLSLFIFLFLLR